MTKITEDIVEGACLDILRALGFHTLYGPEIGPGGSTQERDSWSDVILVGRLSDAIHRVNPTLSSESVDAAVAAVLRAESQNGLSENLRIHGLTTHGVPVEYRSADGAIRNTLAWLIDFEHPERNDWLAVNQFTVVESGKNRRPDVVLFLNGLPVGLVELKNPGDENATLKGAFNQIQTYRHDIGTVFAPNVVTVISDGLGALMGSFSAGFEHFAPWKTIDGREVVTDRSQLEVLIRGVFEPKRFLDLVRNFVVFSDEPSGLVKRVAKYHQYWAVNAALESTIEASRPDGDRRGGVVWHTQGSGKSFEMLCYAAKAMKASELANPTLVLITDRNDLDDQLFSEVFAPARILPEAPRQANSRAEMRQMLDRVSGGIIFTTLQKFAPDEKGDPHPLLTDRRNVIVIADEAHRSQYDFLDGYARHLRDALPNATYLGFTGTPIESIDKSTRAVFGDYVDIYDLTRAVDDGATVRIYYESRLAKVHLDERERETLDETVEEVTEGEEFSQAQRAKSKWARLEAVVGADSRLDLVAADVVDHWEKRREEMVGKAMVVCMSRRICVDLADKIAELRPEWFTDDPTTGKVKVVMTGSATDPEKFQHHLYSKQVLRDIKARAKDPDDELEIVIVRDMWLTGFDSPALNTMYVDKPMRGAGLMQAIARVNRTFRDKPGGLIVDYLGIAQNLREALSDYSPTDREQAGVPIEQVVGVVIEKHGVICDLLHEHTWSSDPALSGAERLNQLAATVDFVLADPDRKARFQDQTLALAKAYALAGGNAAIQPLRDDVRFFVDVRGSIAKIDREGAPGTGGTEGSEALDTAIAQLVSQAVSADQVLDIYGMAGMERPDISILSDAFLEDMGRANKPNLQMALLRKLLADEIHVLQRTNLVQSRLFSDMLDNAIAQYTNRSLTTAEIVAELVELAKRMRDAQSRGEEMGLSEAEVAFYDAIVQNDSAVIAMGDDTLKEIAAELVRAVRESATIDWNLKDSVRAAMRAKVKRLLARYDYPPDKEERAIDLVIEQAELMSSAA